MMFVLHSNEEEEEHQVDFAADLTASCWSAEARRYTPAGVGNRPLELCCQGRRS
jgi:hypothetical protein